MSAGTSARLRPAGPPGPTRRPGCGPRAWAFTGPGQRMLRNYRHSPPERAARLMVMVEAAAEVAVALRRPQPRRSGAISCPQAVTAGRSRKSPVGVRIEVSSTRSCTGIRSMSTQPGKFRTATGEREKRSR